MLISEWVIWHQLWITDVRTKKSGYDTWCPGALFHVISAKYSVARNVIRHKEIDRSGRDAIRCLSSNRVSHSGPRYYTYLQQVLQKVDVWVSNCLIFYFLVLRRSLPSMTWYIRSLRNSSDPRRTKSLGQNFPKELSNMVRCSNHDISAKEENSHKRRLRHSTSLKYEA